MSENRKYRKEKRRTKKGERSKKKHSANRVKRSMVRIAPRKVRLVVDLIRGEGVDNALNILQFTNKRAAPLVLKMIETALNNIDQSEKLDWDVDDLVINVATVDEGPTLRRFKPRAQGRATRINKRTSHITLELQPR